MSKKENLEYNLILAFLDRIKVNNKWEKFFITPHILTEICTHLRTHNKDPRFKDIVANILPLLESMKENIIEKDKIINHFNSKSVIEIGDVSIYLSVEDFTQNRKKISILSIDRGFKEKYRDDIGVMVMDYRTNILSTV